MKYNYAHKIDLIENLSSGTNVLRNSLETAFMEIVSQIR